MQVFLDTADTRDVVRLLHDVDGFTSNPSMASAIGMTCYLDYARRMLECTGGKSTSLEVLADEPEAIYAQGMELTALGENVVVKVPITTSEGKLLVDTMIRLQDSGVRVNATCVFTPWQAKQAEGMHIISVFAGRASYCGIDPKQLMNECVRAVSDSTSSVLWAGVMEPQRMYEAEQVGCRITTVPAGVMDRFIKGQTLRGEDFSLESVQEFCRAARTMQWTV